MARTARKEREVDRIREDIVRAAAQMALSQGMGSLTLKGIAEACGYTVKTLYSYFDSKEAILEAMTDLVFRSCSVAFHMAPPSGLTIEQRFEFLTRHALSIAEGYREVLLVLIGTHGGPESPVRAQIQEECRKWLEAYSRRDELGGFEVREVVIFFFGAMEAVLTCALATRPEISFQDLTPRILQLLFGGIRSPSTERLPQ